MACVNRKKYANADWNLLQTEDGRIADWEQVKISVLMDIRDELQNLNRRISCTNFREVIALLRGIRVNTRKPAKKRTKKPAGKDVTHV